MNVYSSRRVGRRQLVVITTAVLLFVGFAMIRSQQGASAHEVITPYPLTCSMVGLSPTFTTNHTPTAGTTPGGTVVLDVNMATPATGMAMPVKMVEFSLPKPALIQTITGVSFKAGGNFLGSASIDAAGTINLMFMGNTQSNTMTLPVFDITAVTKTSAVVGDKVSWMGPSTVKLDGGSTDTCTAPSGSIQYAPTAVVAPDAGCGGPTTTADPAHGDHGDHGTPTTCPPTTAPPTTAPPTTKPPTTAPPTTKPPTTAPPTTKPPTTAPPTTAPTTTGPPVTTPPTTTPMNPFLAFLKLLLCFLFRIGCT
jgi:hypothetical protein